MSSTKNTHIKLSKLEVAATLYRSELRVLNRRYKNRLIRDLVTAFAEESTRSMHNVIRDRDEILQNSHADECVYETINLHSFIVMIGQLDELLTDFKREKDDWAMIVIQDMFAGRSQRDGRKGRAILESIDDDVSVIVRQFRRASGYRKSDPVYPETMKAFRKIQKRVRTGWRSRDDYAEMEEES